MELGFTDPGIEFDPHAVEVVVDQIDDDGLGGPGKVEDFAVFPVITMLFVQLARNIADIVPMVAILWKWHFWVHQLQVAGADTLTEALDLRSGIVEIVLALHGGTDHFQSPADAVAHNGISCMTGVQWAGGIGTDKLDKDTHPGHSVGTTIAIPLTQDRYEGRGQVFLGDEEVQKSGSDNIHLAQQIINHQAGFDLLGQFHGTAAHAPSHNHGNIGGIVTVLA
jgi:hypothetical protein